MALTTVSNVATTWFTALAFQDRLAVADSNLRDAEHILAAIRARLEAGTASELDIAQAGGAGRRHPRHDPQSRNQLEQQVIGARAS